MKIFVTLFVISSVMFLHRDKLFAQNDATSLRTSTLRLDSDIARIDEVDYQSSKMADSASTDLQSRANVFGGITSPTGEFSTPARGTNSAGSANMGFNVGADFSADITRGFELGFIAIVNILSFDALSSNIEGDSWRFYELLGTIGGFSMNSQNLRFYCKGYLGALYSTYPTLTYKDQKRTMRESDNYVSPRYGIGVGGRLFNQYDLNVRVLWANAEYKGSTYTYPTNSYPISSDYFFKQPLTTIQISLGINILTLKDRRVSKR